jgi:molecular chaperone GrpE
MTKKYNDPDNGHQHDDAPHGHAHAHGHGHEHPHAEQAQDPDGQPSAADDDPQALKAQLEAKETELAELKDKYLRALADFENARKRIRSQSEESVKLQKEMVLRDVLPIVDNLERALEASRSTTDTKVIIDGVEMVVRSLLDFLRVHGVTPVTTVGQSFDPNRHEAVDHVESEKHAPNTIVAEFHRGYQIGDRTLRPARVSVAKGKTSGDAPDSERSSSED